MALDSFGLNLKQRLFCENYLSNGYKKKEPLSMLVIAVKLPPK